MLLELRQLAGALREAGIGVASWDPRLREYGKYPALVVELDEAGAVARLGLVTPERLARWRTFQVSTGGSQESTPGFSMLPLLKLASAGEKDAYARLIGSLAAMNDGPEERAGRLDALVAMTEPNRDPGKATKLRKRLHDAARTLLGLLPDDGAVPPEVKPLRAVLERSTRLDVEGFRDRLLAAARARLVAAESAAEAEALARLLFLRKDADRVTLVLELDERSRDGGTPANTERTFERLNGLLAGARCDDAPGQDGSGAGIFGEPAAADGAKMPQVKLPRLSNVSLRSLSKYKPCQARYGLIESAACPVGPSARQELHDALHWVVRPEREWKTWADVSRSCGLDKSAILVAYPSTLPATDDPFAQLLAGEVLDPEGREVAFEDVAARVAARLRALEEREATTEVRVFVLVKADPARTKVAFSRSFSAARIVAASDEWRRGLENLPPITIREFPRRRGDAVPVGLPPAHPGPAALIACLNTRWMRLGTYAQQAPGLTIGDGITLLLDDAAAVRALARRALALAIQNGHQLLTAIGQAQHQGRVHAPPGASGAFAQQARTWPAALGLLLDKLGSVREAYMRDAPYLVGRLLSVADTLHHQYCAVVRDGSTPPTLVGGAMMSLALEDPTAALAQLAQRMQVYLAWAKTANGSNGRELALARWALAELGELGRLLGEGGPLPGPGSCDDRAKAQMLLGYLARPPKKAEATAPAGDSEVQQ
jgi:hypothetical protein